MPLDMKKADMSEVFLGVRKELANLAEELRRNYPFRAEDKPQEFSKNLMLDRFLLEFSFATDGLSLRERTVLDFLSRCMEVQRKLYSCYAPPDPRPVTQSLASELDVELLMLCYLDRFMVTGDWRFINTVLKVLDGILIAPMVCLGSSLRCVAEQCLVEMIQNA